MQNKIPPQRLVDIFDQQRARRELSSDVVKAIDNKDFDTLDRLLRGDAQELIKPNFRKSNLIEWQRHRAIPEIAYLVYRKDESLSDRLDMLFIERLLEMRRDEGTIAINHVLDYLLLRVYFYDPKLLTSHNIEFFRRDISRILEVA